VKYEEHIEHLRSEAYGFADAVAASDPDVTVTTCPDWTVRDLSRHLGQLYRWSARIVDDGLLSGIWPHQVPVQDPTSDDWAGWIREAVDAAVEVFTGAEPSKRVWVWGADPHARFWPRRMLFETVVHRLDIAITNGAPIELTRDIAVDGIDEWFENLRHVGQWQISVTKLAGDGRVLTFATEETDDTWRVQLVPNGWWWDRSSERGEVHVTAPAADVLLLLVGRPVAGAAVEGDQALLREWLTATAF